MSIENLEPITSAIGFLRASPSEIAAETALWWSKLGRATGVTEHPRGIVDEYHHLLPLTLGSRPRLLLVRTDSPWTAVFDCGAGGGDPESFVGHMHQVMDVPGLVANYVEDSTAPVRYGAVQLHVFSPHQSGLGYLRTLDATRDGGARWQFAAAGATQSFEDEALYDRRRVRDRFTAETLAKYLDAVGIRFFDERFYGGPSVLIEHINDPGVLAELSLAEARSRLGYT